MCTNQAFEIFASAVKAVRPQVLLPKYVSVGEGLLCIAEHNIELSGINKFKVIAAGKAAPAMAHEIENQIGDLITEGICITKYQHSMPLRKFRTIEAAHPVPDKNSIIAGKMVLQAVQNSSPNDIILLLISGGASSLLADTPKGCNLEDIQKVFDLLVNSGASIRDINIVRKHLSNIKGGQLAKAAYPATVITMIISDVVGDDLSSIASGPTVPDSSVFEDAYQILTKYAIWNPIGERVREYIKRGINSRIEETPKPGSHYFKKSFAKIIGNNRLALDAGKLSAEESGYRTILLDDQLIGNTEIEAVEFVQRMVNYVGKLPACFLMGGETTLNVTGDGKGGRNQHFALCALSELLNYKMEKPDRHITILSGGTDGSDGPTNAAGAVIDTDMLKLKMTDKDIIREHLNRFDAYSFFERAGGLILTGPTQTNVMDIVVGLISH